MTNALLAQVFMESKGKGEDTSLSFPITKKKNTTKNQILTHCFITVDLKTYQLGPKEIPISRTPNSQSK